MDVRNEVWFTWTPKISISSERVNGKGVKKQDGSSQLRMSKKIKNRLVMEIRLP